MKRLSYFFFIAIIFMFLTCKRDTEVYSIYRQTNKQNFKNIRGGEAYAFAANDSVIVNADYFMQVLGQIQNYGSEILNYGFCWSQTANPLLDNKGFYYNNDSLHTALPGPTDSISFIMPIRNLKASTQYYVRSYIIIGDGQGNAVDTAYNPIILKKRTEDAINEWFLLSPAGKELMGFRFDALAFNFGDTIFYGTGNAGNGFLSKEIHMYDPRTDSWKKYPKNLMSVQLPVQPPNTLKAELINGIGFALAFKEKNGPQSDIRKYMFIGMGDYNTKGDGDYRYKTETLIAFDLEKPENPLYETSIYPGRQRSDAVCFVIGSKAYVGTGSGRGPTSDWYVFDPDKDKIKDPQDPGWQKIPSPSDFSGELKRTGAIAFSINGRGYFGLGMDDKGIFYNDFWQFTPSPNPEDPMGGSWQRLPNFPGLPRANASAFVIDNQGYVGTGDNFTPITPGDFINIESDPPNYTGVMFSDVYRYDPFNNRWLQEVRDYTLDSKINLDKPKKVTRGIGFSSPKNNIGFIGYGIVPTDQNRAQGDLWYYQPY